MFQCLHKVHFTFFPQLIPIPSLPTQAGALLPQVPLYGRRRLPGRAHRRANLRPVDSVRVDECRWFDCGRQSAAAESPGYGFVIFICISKIFKLDWGCLEEYDHM
jgi:hypothetical protein